MAHECPDCYQECYCDMDDTHMDAPDDCSHECAPDDEEDFDECEDDREAWQEIVDDFNPTEPKP